MKTKRTVCSNDPGQSAWLPGITATLAPYIVPSLDEATASSFLRLLVRMLHLRGAVRELRQDLEPQAACSRVQCHYEPICIAVLGTRYATFVSYYTCKSTPVCQIPRLPDLTCP